jgi:hypothetical protein
MAQCAVNTGLDFHLLDHIAPLASLKKIELIVNEEECAQLCTKHYPEVDVKFIPDLELNYHKIAEQYDSLIQCRLWSPQVKMLFQTYFKKEMKLIFCPHGQSDKGYAAPVLSPYAQQDHVLLYGSLLKEMLIDTNLWTSLKGHSFIGNYRLAYYQTHRQQHLKIAKQEIFSHLTASNKTLLYAPTWNDADEATSFFIHCEKIVRDLPSHWNLLIKLHPLLEQRDPSLFYRLASLDLKKTNLIVVDKFPLIYPILDTIDAYLGDYSSIGYDLLAFEKPMFFIQQKKLPAARLHTCGQIIEVEKNIFETIEANLEKANSFKTIQRHLYKKAFTNPH